MSLRLGFHYHVPMHLDDYGRLRTPGYLGRFLDSLAAHSESLTCFMHLPRADELAQMDYTIQAGNVHWVNIGPHTSIPKRMLGSRQFTKPLRERRRDLDTLLIRGPSPLLPAMARAAGDIPITLLIVGDYLAGVDDLPQPRWRKEAIRVWSHWNYRQQMAIARKSLTFVNSHRLYEQFQHQVPNLVETRTTTLNEDDFFEREDTCQGKLIRLLYTGRMDRAKGLFEMVHAVELLRKAGYNVVLDLVGWPAKGDTIIQELKQDATTRGVNAYVFFHGFKSVGPELFAYYKQADIFLTASQNSEGFPRTIWEAMAHSLPVVATKVGSIPLFLTHRDTAWLLDDISSRAIVGGVLTLVKDASLRKHLITQARQFASANTLERTVPKVLAAIDTHLQRNQ